MNPILEVHERKTIRSWVQFELRDVEDREASKREGKYVGRDVEYVLITPAYGKDDVHKKVSVWKEDLYTKLQGGFISQEDYNFYIAKYEAWKKGLEAPPNGTPIKGWGICSPAQQKLLLSIGILTVEDLSTINDEGIRRIGMGGVELKRKAIARISQMQDKGPLTQKMAAVEAQNDNLKIQVETLMKQVHQLSELAKQAQTVPVPSASQDVTIADLVDEEPVKRGPGRPRKEG